MMKMMIAVLFGFLAVVIAGVTAETATASGTSNRTLDDTILFRNNIRDELRVTIDKIEQDIAKDKEECDSIVQEHAADNDAVKLKKQALVQKMKDELDEEKKLIESSCAATTPTECDASWANYNATVVEKMEANAKELRHLSRDLAEDSLPGFVAIEASVLNDQRLLDEARQQIHVHISSPEFTGLDDFFETELVKIQGMLVELEQRIGRITNFVSRLRSIVFGTMCLQFDGVSGEIIDFNTFQDVTQVALESVMAAEATGGDVLVVKLVKQELQDCDGRRLRGSSWVDKVKLVAGSIIGVNLCDNCHEDELDEDSWRRSLQSVLGVGTTEDADRRRLSENMLGEEYVAALNYKIKEGVFVGVEKVTLIECGDFLHGDSLDVIHSF